MSYYILWNHGMEGWTFSDESYGSAKEALAEAMAYCTGEFKIVKVVDFEECE